MTVKNTGQTVVEVVHDSGKYYIEPGREFEIDDSNKGLIDAAQKAVGEQSEQVQKKNNATATDDTDTDDDTANEAE